MEEFKAKVLASQKRKDVENRKKAIHSEQVRLRSKLQVIDAALREGIEPEALGIEREKTLVELSHLLNEG